MKHSRLAAATFLVLVTALWPHPSPAATRISAKTIAKLDFPTGMRFTPSGDRLFVNERGGRIRIIKRGKLLSRPFATLRTTTGAESGLLGLALHPRFEHGKPWVYVFFTRADGATDRVMRLVANGDVAVRRSIIFDDMPAGGYHHGGIVAFGPDGKLYVSNGEAHSSDRAQNPRVLGGKIYRLNDDGSIPSDNPFPGEPTFAYGIRNPFGLAFDPQSGNLWETENGPNNHDEINLIERGKNYGWPVVRGRAGNSRFVDPVRDYRDIIVPTMAAFGGDALAPAFRGNFFFGTYASQVIHRLVLSDDRKSVRRDLILFNAGDGVVGMTMGPDGLYFTTPSKVVRLTALPAPTSSVTGSPSPAATSTQSAPKKDESSSTPVYVLVGIIAAALGGTIALLVYRARRS
ncbi:MAG: sorbosone dehydrogenase family protein [Actinomycetota bacterium]|nr:PQQ-dependent sugar dehydrogenase [Actinomycetota bacterium]